MTDIEKNAAIARVFAAALTALPDDLHWSQVIPDEDGYGVKLYCPHALCPMVGDLFYDRAFQLEVFSRACARAIERAERGTEEVAGRGAEGAAPVPSDDALRWGADFSRAARTSGGRE